ncbi:MAG TPA: exodeoxyribonuclease VII small subunit [Synergistales bacterium]|nr:exodeoxyribonuclease VII small subunit [Synergistales bacterium]
MSFSKEIEALQAIVKRLESEPMPLEEAMKLFEEGMAKAEKCKAFLDQARQKVILLSEGDNSGGTAWDPLSGEEAVS